MEVSCELVREGRVFIYHMSGMLDLREMAHWVSKWEKEILDVAEQPVYYITDFSGVTGVPARSLSGAIELSRKPSPKLKMTVVVAKNTFVTTTANLASRVIRTFSLRVAGSMEDAWVIVERALAEEVQAQQKTAK